MLSLFIVSVGVLGHSSLFSTIVFPAQIDARLADPHDPIVSTKV
jgi:hypothetical protein